MAPKSTSVSVDDLPTAFPQQTCLRRGLCPVTSLRHQTSSTSPSDAVQSHSLYFEQHGKPGTDPVTGAKHKILFIMGLNSSSFSWGPQVRYFGGGGPMEDCTAVVFDNRGVGNSGYPWGPYSSSGMAEDAICLLDYLGWTGDRDVHIVGISLGGMIAQELAYRIPHRIASLVLAVTTPGGLSLSHIPPMKGVMSLTKVTFTPDPLKKVPIALDMLFPREFLDSKADSDPHAEWPGDGNGNTKDNKMGKTNYDIQKEGFLYRIAVAKPQGAMGVFSQMAAALTHDVSPSRLATIASRIPKIIIVTGDDDNLVNPANSKRIKKGMDGSIKIGHKDLGEEEYKKRVEYIQWEGVGHAIHAQCEVRFNELVERCVREGREIVERGWTGAA